MNRMLVIISHAVMQGIVFCICIVVLFNMLSDFAQKLQLVPIVLERVQIQLLGLVSTALAMMNALSNKFFGFAILY